MKTLTESIPTVFNPETAFALSVQQGDEKSSRADEAFIPHWVMPPPADDFFRHGVPWSAIHD